MEQIIAWHLMNATQKEKYLKEKFSLFGKNHSYSRSETSALRAMGLLSARPIEK